MVERSIEYNNLSVYDESPTGQSSKLSFRLLSFFPRLLESEISLFHSSKNGNVCLSVFPPLWSRLKYIHLKNLITRRMPLVVAREWIVIICLIDLCISTPISLHARSACLLWGIHSCLLACTSLTLFMEIISQTHTNQNSHANRWLKMASFTWDGAYRTCLWSLLWSCSCYRR